jgi:hypothetical protein
MNSRVYPKYKLWKHCFQVYLVTNWAEYDRALVWRCDITLWISAETVEGFLRSADSHFELRFLHRL